jgi:hypothetical protein
MEEQLDFKKSAELSDDSPPEDFFNVEKPQPKKRSLSTGDDFIKNKDIIE